MARTTIKRVALRNIDRKTPSEITTQGSLSKAHNIRYNDTGIENICEFETKELISKSNNFRVVYIHSNKYLAYDINNNLHHVHVLFGSVESTAIIATRLSENTTISSFGKILFLTDGNNQRSFIYTNGVYEELKINNIQPLDTVDIGYEYTQASNTAGYDSCMVLGYTSISKRQDEYILKLEEVRSADFIPGIFYLMFAYRLFDGSIIKPSRAYMVAQSDESSASHLFYRVSNCKLSDGDTYTYGYSYPISGSKVTLNIDFDGDLVNNKLIRSVVVYATRPQQEFDFARAHDIFETSPQQEQEYIFKTSANYFRFKEIIDYPTRPFYEIDELLLSSAIGNKLTKELVWSDHFEYIEHGAVFEPTFTVHNTVHKNIFEYNGRMHSSNQTTTLYNGANILHSKESHSYGNKTNLPSGYTIYAETTLRIDDKIMNVKCDDIGYYYWHEAVRPSGNYNCIIIDNMISYPDHRAEKITIYLAKGNIRKKIVSFTLTSSLANNFAYNMGHDVMKSHTQYYYTFSNFEDFSSDSGFFTGSQPISYRDKIMVSMANNPFAFEPRHTYSIEGDDCEIYKLTTAVAGLTEESYGVHPVLVFTSKGLFALQQGAGDILYSKVVLIDNSDRYRIDHAVSLSSIVFFISSDEVMAITSRTTKSVSEIICPSNSLPLERERFKRYMLGARPYALIWYDEVMIYNEDFDYAYIYSITSNCWSTRSLNAKGITDSVMLVEGDLISLSNKENKNKPLPITIKTNTMTLGSDNYKKLEYLDILFSAPTNMNINTTIWGSNDLLEWYNIGSSLYGRKIGRSGRSWRYFRVEISTVNSTTTDNYIYLWGVDIKYTTKYVGVVE